MSEELGLGLVFRARGRVGARARAKKRGSERLGPVLGHLEHLVRDINDGLETLERS